MPLVELSDRQRDPLCHRQQRVAAFDEPGLMDQKVFFHVRSHGYEFPKDGFGYRGKAFRSRRAGGHAEDHAGQHRRAALPRDRRRHLPRQRPGRRSSADPTSRSSTARCSAPTAWSTRVYRGKVYWFWGDTNRPGLSAGQLPRPRCHVRRCRAKAGSSPRRHQPELLPRREGLRHGPLPRCPGNGPDLDRRASVVLARPRRRERMFAGLRQGPAAAGGLRARAGRIRSRNEASSTRWPSSRGAAGSPASIPTAIRSCTSEDGVEYVYFAHPYPLMRVPADPERSADPAAYEAYTCLKQGTRLDERQDRPRRRTALRYGWKKNTPHWSRQEQADKLITAGRLQARGDACCTAGRRHGQGGAGARRVGLLERRIAGAG